MIRNQIRSGIELSSSDYDKEKLQERLAKLSGGVAVLKVCFTLITKLFILISCFHAIGQS